MARFERGAGKGRGHVRLSDFVNHERCDDDGVNPDEDDHDHAQLGGCVGVALFAFVAEELFAAAKDVETGPEEEQFQQAKKHLQPNRGTGSGSRDREELIHDDESPRRPGAAFPTKVGNPKSQNPNPR